jgi:pimeloyl-ACP methyl ester carboxylesterase
LDFGLQTPIEEWREVEGLRTFSRTVGAGEEVVLVHGAGVSTEYWRPAQRALAARGGFRVHALDLPGFGRSQDPPWPPEMPRLAAHLNAWLEQAAGGPCHLVGQSLGCEVAVIAAAARPEGVRRLALAAPAGLPAPPPVTEQVLAALVDAPREPLALYRAILPAYFRCGFVRMFRLLHAQRGHATAALLERLPHPALVVRGERDPVVTVERQAAVAAKLQRAEVATIPGAHGAHFAFPEAFARVVAAFLAAGEGPDVERPGSPGPGPPDAGFLPYGRTWAL